MSQENPAQKIAQINKIEPKENFFKTFLWALLFAVFIRSFALEPFHIPSSSMYPNLLIGDYIFVNKFSYGYSRYSFPFGFKIFEGRILKSTPKRGDIIVFRLPSQPSINYVKRLIGLPGDKIQMRDGTLYINDNEVLKVFKGDSFEIENDKKFNFQKYQETLPEGRQIFTYNRANTPQDNTGIYTVPENYYFFMGDNRDDSQDSRFLNFVGYVPEENLVGRASTIFFSNPYSIFEFGNWVQNIRFDRIGKTLNK
ncbi:MAG: signal peptidase I [Alphaproteobacteria bacterium]|nr:signal peptidase I [Alphaproteobacteria bacterium]